MILGAVALSNLVCEEPLATKHTWVSHNENYAITHIVAADLTRDDGEAQQKRACYVLQAIPQPDVLWAGVSYSDCSAHSSDVVWSPDSVHALILDRPQRGEAFLILLACSAKPNARNIELKPVIDTMDKSEDADVRVLTKVWFEDDWVWVNNHTVSGTLCVARSSQHKIKLSLNIVKDGSVKLSWLSEL